MTDEELIDSLPALLGITVFLGFWLGTLWANAMGLPP